MGWSQLCHERRRASEWQARQCTGGVAGWMWNNSVRSLLGQDWTSRVEPPGKVAERKARPGSVTLLFLPRRRYMSVPNTPAMGSPRRAANPWSPTWFPSRMIRLSLGSRGRSAEAMIDRPGSPSWFWLRWIEVNLGTARLVRAEERTEAAWSAICVWEISRYRSEGAGRRDGGPPPAKPRPR